MAALLLLGCFSCSQETQQQSSSKPVEDTVILHPEWKPFFDTAGVAGVMVLHEVGSNAYQASGEEYLRQGYLPASTFKIFNALVALQEGAVGGPNDTLRWDGVPRRVEVWNQDHTLASAMKCSAVWYYQEMARRIGREKMEDWMRKAQYGNGQTGSAIDSFWLRGALRITPIEQVRFLEMLAEDSLPFRTEVQQMVKDMLVLDTTSGRRFWGKTGWADLPGDDTGWFVGMVERSGRKWTFANLIFIRRDEDAPSRRAIAEQILRQQGILP